jgi:hypothetical protein
MPAVLPSLAVTWPFMVALVPVTVAVPLGIADVTWSTCVCVSLIVVPAQANRLRLARSWAPSSLKYAKPAPLADGYRLRPGVPEMLTEGRLGEKDPLLPDVLPLPDGKSLDDEVELELVGEPLAAAGFESLPVVSTIAVVMPPASRAQLRRRR